MSRYARVSEWLSEKRAAPVLTRMRDLYAAEVTMTDRWLAVLLARLRDLGLDGNTVIALVADHGFLLGEYGWTGKISSMLHPPLIRVPFILVDPAGRQAGQTSAYLAQTHDVGPTLLAMAGVARSGSMDGVNLSPLLARRTAARTLPRLRWLLQLAVRPHRPLGLRLREPRPRATALRSRSGSGRGDTTWRGGIRA